MDIIWRHYPSDYIHGNFLVDPRIPSGLLTGMRLLFLVASLLLGPLAAPCLAQSLPGGVTDHFFLSSDGVRLHYLEAGPSAAHTLVFVPGWTIPAWIWMPQIQAFSRRYHVVAFDPRGQGDSAAPASGYEPVRRGRDVAELIDRLGNQSVVVIGWSLGVLDTLASIHVAGDSRLAGLVLVDNSVGEEPAPAPPPFRSGPHRNVRPPSYPEFNESVRSRHVPPPAAAGLS